MVRSVDPELKKYMNKRLAFQLNANRKITGILRGYDAFMNLVLDEAVEHSSQDKNDLHPMGMILVRGNSIILMEALENTDNTSAIQ
jgi:small nuclear ribonucleoprotein G